jgi:hypothetical protein
MVVCLALAAELRAQPARFVFPADPKTVVNARTDCGAKGDGVADDTEALQKAIDLSCGIGQPTTRLLFIPDGVYRVTRPLVVKSGLGPWLSGESRDGAIIRLADGSADATCVLRTHPNEKPPTSADWFMRNIRNLTIDAGANPNADGIRFYATNSGILQNVRVVGRGPVGINSAFLEQNGPNLIQDCVVEGFETGLKTQWNWGQTLSRVTLRDCRKAGLVTAANVVAAEDLVIENVPEPVLCDRPNDWYWWGGVLAVHGGRITGAHPAAPAVRNRSVLYLRDVTVKGYGSAVESQTPGGARPGEKIEEYLAFPPEKLFDAPDKAVRLPTRREPTVAWETDLAKWECANEHGVTAGDNQDDTAALQKAVDAAAAAGKTVVYLRGTGGREPNWYNLNGEVRVHGSVRWVLGLGWARVLGPKDGSGRFVLTDDSAPAVKFRNIDAFGGSPITIENRSSRSDLVVESCGVHVRATGGGATFLTDCPANLSIEKAGAKAYCRQLNPEGDSDDGLVRNAGGDLWVLGMKCEGRGVRLRATAGSRTEIFGAFIYGPGIKPDDRRPIFDIDNSALCVLGLREISFGGGMYNLKVRETRGGETRTLGIKPGHGWIGWTMYSGWTDRPK